MKKRGPILLTESAEASLRRTKLIVCHALKRACRQRNWNQSQAATMLRTSRAQMSRVDRLKVDELTLNFLFRGLACTCLRGFEVMISL